MSKCLWSGGSGSEELEEMLSPFPCSPVIRECSWKKTQIEKKSKTLKQSFVFDFHMKAKPIQVNELKLCKI